MSTTVLFVGLDEITTSIGLAMGEAEFDVVRLGFHPDRKVARAAKRAGAIDKAVRPEKAVGNASIVIVGDVSVFEPDLREAGYGEVEVITDEGFGEGRGSDEGGDDDERDEEPEG